MDSYETILKYLRTTKTTTGLAVKAYLDRNAYQKGIKISNEEMRELNISQPDALPKWNYTLHPKNGK